MSKYELIDIKGGVAITSALLSAVTKAVTTIYDIARRFGTAIYRTQNGVLCKN